MSTRNFKNILSLSLIHFLYMWKRLYFILTDWRKIIWYQKVLILNTQLAVIACSYSMEWILFMLIDNYFFSSKITSFTLFSKLSKLVSFINASRSRFPCIDGSCSTLSWKFLGRFAVSWIISLESIYAYVFEKFRELYYGKNRFGQLEDAVCAYCRIFCRLTLDHALFILSLWKYYSGWIKNE